MAGVSARKPFGERVFDICNICFFSVLSALMLYPLWWVFATSIAEPKWLSTNIVKLFPNEVRFKTYTYIFQERGLWVAYYNSVKYTLMALVLTMALCTTLAYALAIKSYGPRKLVTLMMVFTMFFSGGIIPTYMLIVELKLLDTGWAWIIPMSLSPYFTILLRTSFRPVVEDLREAAMIDGANDFRVYWQIVLPLSKAVLATIALFAIVRSWNQFFGPLIYITSEEKIPLTIYLRRLIITSQIDASNYLESEYGTSGMELMAEIKGQATAIKMGVIVVTLVPVLCIYPFVQKYFIKGAMLGSLKG
jgi:putative aldouronate transport system permease protein